MSVRLRRLASDYETVKRLVRRHPRIQIEGVSGNPPDRYRLVLLVRSLQRDGASIKYADSHRVEINLPGTYPRDPPYCRMLTPVFHPNVEPHAVCVGDHWSAGESLVNLIQRIGEMLAFQCYNVKSPLNGEAARWVEEHPDQLPVDASEFFIDIEEAPAAPAADTQACSNCGTTEGQLVTCTEGHALCPDCIVECPTCQLRYCLVCSGANCPQCTQPDCANCGSHQPQVTMCARGHRLCHDCHLVCQRCGRLLCLACGDVNCMCG